LKFNGGDGGTLQPMVAKVRMHKRKVFDTQNLFNGGDGGSRTRVQNDAK